MTGTMENLTASAHEQATGAGEVTSAVAEMDPFTQQNAALSGDRR